MKIRIIFRSMAIAAFLAGVLFAQPAPAQEGIIGSREVEKIKTRENSEDLAKKLANPVASLISVPFQFN